MTATVDCIPLIASSIMSKKIAEGADALTLDVKFGSGAFMKEYDAAEKLARTMVRLGAAHGVKTTAVLTSMENPLGRSAGNALEVAESVEVLAGGGPADVVELTLVLAREMLTAVGIDTDPASVLASGKAMDKWNEMIAAQGGNPSAELPVAAEKHDVVAERDGVLAGLDALSVGVAAWRLGAGRARKEDPVSATAGVTWHAGIGDSVRKGQPLLTLHADDASRFERALESLEGAVTITDGPVEPPKLIRTTIRENWSSSE